MKTTAIALVSVGAFFLSGMGSWIPWERDACPKGQYKDDLTRICLPGVRVETPRLPRVDQVLPAEVRDMVSAVGAVPHITTLAGAVFARVEAPNKTLEVLQRAPGETMTALAEKGKAHLVTVQKTVSDVAAAYEKGWRDATEQATRSFDDTVEAGKAVTRYTERQLESWNTIIPNNVRRLQEGKVVDAMWGLATDPLRATEKNFALATQESHVIAAAAQSAAATYGGPGGAAAYAAWATYNLTGDANLALRAGTLAAINSQAGSMAPAQADSIIRKVALAGAAGGIAVAAAGGDEAAITEGFLKSGSAVLVQAGTDAVKGYSPDAAQATQAVQCISARDLDCFSRTPYMTKDGKILYDKGKALEGKVLDEKDYLGKWSQRPPNSELAQKAAWIAKISKLQDMEAIPLKDNEWVLTWSMGSQTDMQANVPSVVLTRIGSNKPFFSRVTYGDTATIAAGVRPKTSISPAVLKKAIRIRRGTKVISYEKVGDERLPNYRYYAWLDLTPRQADEIKAVQYYFEAETFVNPKRGMHNGDSFEARWIGWGCAYEARVVATLTDDSKITGRFDMCEVRGP